MTSNLVPAQEIAEKSGFPVCQVSDMSTSILLNAIWPTVRQASLNNREELNRAFDALCESLESIGKRYDKDIFLNIDRNRFYNSIMHEKRDSKYLLMGPPGHGKTSVFRETARLFAEKMGVPFLVNPSPDVSIPENAYVFYTLELSGEHSATDVKGLPGIKGEGEEDKTTVRLKPDYILALEKAKYGMLIFDDIANASPQVISALHGLIQDRKTYYGSHLKESIAMGGTGNLGVLDGSHAKELSSAIKGRFKVRAVYEELAPFLAFVKDKHGYSLSKMLDIYFNAYAPEGVPAFGGVPVRSGLSQAGVDTSPRAWVDKIIDSFSYELTNLSHLDPITLGELTNEISRDLPDEVGRSFASYINNFVHSLTPMVSEAYQGRGPLPNKFERFGSYFDNLTNGFKSTALKDEFALVAAGMVVSDVQRGANVGESVARFCNAIARAEFADHEYSQAFRILKSVMIDRLGDEYVINLNRFPGDKERGLDTKYAKDIKEAMSALRDHAHKDGDEELLRAFESFRPIASGDGESFAQLGVFELFASKDLGQLFDEHELSDPKKATKKTAKSISM